MFVESDGARIHYDTSGDGEPVILLAGFGAAGSYWRRMPPLLDGFLCVTMDNRGVGDTVYDGPFSMADMADDAVAVMDGLGIGKAHVVGWSMGSHIARKLACRHPDRVADLTLVGTYLQRPARSDYVLRGMLGMVIDGKAPMECLFRSVNAFCLTESDAGSDAAKGQTEAKLDGDHYVLNGSKIFITNGYVADVFVVFAMTDKTKGTRGISAFIVESSFPGFSVGKHEEKMGLHGSPTAEIVFTDCIVPKENLLGQEGKGFKIAMQTLDGGRIGIAAQALGIAEGAMEEAMAYTKGRVQFGKPISKFQNTQFTFADMAMRSEAGRLLTYQAAVLKGEGKRFTKEAAMAKLFCSEHAMLTTTKALQMFGGYGYTKDYPLERMMRDAKITEIYEGTSEIQRVVISGNIGL